MSRLLEIVRRVVRQELAGRRGPSLGVVSAVFAHESEDDEHNYEVSVRLKHEDLELVRVPMSVAHMGWAAPPRLGELVLVHFVENDLNQPVVSGRFYHDEERPPLHREDDVLFEQRLADGTLNHLRLTPDGTIYLQRDVTKPEDNSEARTTLRIDGETGAVDVKIGETEVHVSEEEIRLAETARSSVAMNADGFTLSSKVPFTIDASGQPVEIIGSTIDFNKG